jgi:hypothetical protein
LRRAEHNRRSFLSFPMVLGWSCVVRAELRWGKRVLSCGHSTGVAYKGSSTWFGGVSDRIAKELTYTCVHYTTGGGQFQENNDGKNMGRGERGAEPASSAFPCWPDGRDDSAGG